MDARNAIIQHTLTFNALTEGCGRMLLNYRAGLLLPERKTLRKAP